MLVKKRSFLEIMLPLTILIFIGQGSVLITTIVSLNMRWFFLLLLFAYGLSRRRLLSGLHTDLRLTLFLYIGWCFLSVCWSEQPALSFLKMGCFFLVIIACVETGFEWVLMKGWRNSLHCFFLLGAFVFILSMVGFKSESSISSINGHAMYQGLTGNSNYFGCLQAFIFPFVLWECYRNWPYQVKRLIWCFLLSLNLAFLLYSFSRSAIVIVFCTATFFMLGLSVKKRIKGLVFCGLLLLPLFSFFSLNMTILIHKGNAENIFASRQTVWSDSLDAAHQGGLMGGGYAVSIGAGDFKWKGLSGTYGREKGSSPLAVIEETGWIGGGLCLLFWVTLLSRLLRYYVRLQGEKKLMLGLILGSMLGLLVLSGLEAWWVAPAAPESIFFWVLYGISVGYMRIMGNCPGPDDSSVGIKK